MPSKKKKTRPTAKSTSKARKRVTKVKITRKPAKKQTRKRVASRARVRRRKPLVSAETELKREFQNRNLTVANRAPARQSEDFAGVSRVDQADSESIEELVEEGNLFEAGAVAGVQDADNADEKEVHTHELPEDDVPEEYEDKD